MNEEIQKFFISPEMLENDSWGFAKKLFKKGLDFDLFVGVTRGGAQVSIYIQEVFSVLTKESKSYATIQAQSYKGVYDAGEVVIDNINGVLRQIKDNTRILVIDDIFDRGKTFAGIKNELLKNIDKKNVSLTMAALYYKPENRIVDLFPDEYYKTFDSDEWIVLPHELEELTVNEMKAKGFIFPD
jgi:hypoxanthine phosphoribosyltransferase